MSVFTDAIRVLEQGGWWQETEEDQGKGSVRCIWLALDDAARANRDSALRYLPVICRVLELPADDDLIGVYDWNDDPHTSYEDVVLALKRAHELAEAE